MPSDDDLMRRYADGDVEAFRRLYGRYEDRVYGFCLRRLGDPDAAADAFQDTFGRLVDARDGYEPRGRFESWLFTLARRACVDLLRARPTDERDAAPTGGSVPPPTAGGRAPDERVARRDELERLLARLTEEQREVLLLSKYQGFSYREVAEITGSTEAAVKQKVYRALRKLREEG